MVIKKILLTGASGCTGSYLLEKLLENKAFEVIAWVREARRLPKVWQDHPRLTVWEGGLEKLAKYREALKTVHILIHPVTIWGGEDSFKVNLYLTQALFNALDPEQCTHIHYFSTASIVDSELNVWDQAWTRGTDYIRSKACMHDWLQRAFQRIPVSIYFPSVILGGDHVHPKTPLTAFLPSLPAYLKWLRFVEAQGHFHFIHAQDVAQILFHRIQHQLQPESLVLGNEPLSVNGLMAELLAFYEYQEPKFRLPLERFLELLLPLLADQMTPWDRFSLHVRNTVYKHTNAATYGLHSELNTFSKVLRKL